MGKGGLLKWAVVILALLRPSAPLVAAVEEEEEQVSVPAEVSGISFGFHLRQFDYHELVNGNTIDSEDGILPGLQVAYEHSLGHGWLVSGALDSGFGKTVYTGATWAGMPLTAQTDNLILDLALELGKEIPLGATSHLTPYTGLGGHLWEREIGGPGGYNEQYVFAYLPVGLRFRQDLSRTLHLGADASFHWNMGGHIAVSDVPGLMDTSGSLGAALGCRAELPLRIDVNEGFSLLASAYFEYFGIGQGDIMGLRSAGSGLSLPFGAREPDSHSFFYGLTLGTQVLF